MGSSAERVWICIKYARGCSHFGQVTNKKKKEKKNPINQVNLKRGVKIHK